MKRKMSIGLKVVCMFAMVGAYPALADLDLTLQTSLRELDGRCRFDFKVTNLKAVPLGEFYVDVEDGLTEQNITASAPPGWNATFCYEFDLQGWSIICFMAKTEEDKIPVGGMLKGFEITAQVSKVNFLAPGDDKKILPGCLHITWTNDPPDDPKGKGLHKCADGTYGPHQDDGRDWDPPAPGAEDGDHVNGGTEWCWRAPGIPTVSEWTAIGMTLLLITAGTIVFYRKRSGETGLA